MNNSWTKRRGWGDRRPKRRRRRECGTYCTLPHPRRREGRSENSSPHLLHQAKKVSTPHLLNFPWFCIIFHAQPPPAAYTPPPLFPRGILYPSPPSTLIIVLNLGSRGKKDGCNALNKRSNKLEHSPNGATATTRKRTAETGKDMPDILFFSFPLFFWPHTYEEGEKVIVPSFFLPFRARAKSNEQSFFSQGEKGIFHAAGRGSPSPCVRELAYVLQYSVYVRGGAGAFTFFFLVFLSPLHDTSMSPNNKGGRGGERGGGAWRKMKHPLSIDMVLVGGESTPSLRGASRLHARLA